MFCAQCCPIYLYHVHMRMACDFCSDSGWSLLSWRSQCSKCRLIRVIIGTPALVADYMHSNPTGSSHTPLFVIFLQRSLIHRGRKYQQIPAALSLGTRMVRSRNHHISIIEYMCVLCANAACISALDSYHRDTFTRSQHCDVSMYNAQYIRIVGVATTVDVFTLRNWITNQD